MSIPSRLATAFVLTGLAAPGLAQSLNIDLGVGGPAGGTVTPSSAYGAAAGQPGHWTPVDVGAITPTGSPAALSDLSGAPTAVTISRSAGGSNSYWWDNVNTTGDDDSLLDDFHDAGNFGTKITYDINGLADGSYDVYFYCWTSYAETDQTTARVIGSGTLAQSCGALWTGAHAYGVTYVVDSINYVASSGPMQLRIKGTAAKWASFNGIQIVDTSAGGAVNYCTPGISASGCQATLSATGTASASATSGFTVMASGAEGAKDGLFFYGQAGQQANSWGNGTSFQCVVTPVKRGGLQTGVGTAGLCDGSFAQDLNARWCLSCSNPNHNPTAGMKMQLQLWYRDPFNTSNQTTSLSDALEVDVVP
jgi:hypothetical protein